MYGIDNRRLIVVDEDQGSRQDPRIEGAAPKVRYISTAIRADEGVTAGRSARFQEVEENFGREDGAAPIPLRAKNVRLEEVRGTALMPR